MFGFALDIFVYFLVIWFWFTAVYFLFFLMEASNFSPNAYIRYLQNVSCTEEGKSFLGSNTLIFLLSPAYLSVTELLTQGLGFVFILLQKACCSKLFSVLKSL